MASKSKRNLKKQLMSATMVGLILTNQSLPLADAFDGLSFEEVPTAGEVTDGGDSTGTDTSPDGGAGTSDGGAGTGSGTGTGTDSGTGSTGGGNSTPSPAQPSGNDQDAFKNPKSLKDLGIENVTKSGLTATENGNIIYIKDAKLGFSALPYSIRFYVGDTVSLTIPKGSTEVELKKILNAEPSRVFVVRLNDQGDEGGKYDITELLSGDKNILVGFDTVPPEIKIEVKDGKFITFGDWGKVYYEKPEVKWTVSEKTYGLEKTTLKKNGTLITTLPNGGSKVETSGNVDLKQLNPEVGFHDLSFKVEVTTSSEGVGEEELVLRYIEGAIPFELSGKSDKTQAITDKVAHIYSEEKENGEVSEKATADLKVKVNVPEELTFLKAIIKNTETQEETEVNVSRDEDKKLVTDSLKLSKGSYKVILVTDTQDRLELGDFTVEETVESLKIKPKEVTSGVSELNAPNNTKWLTELPKVNFQVSDETELRTYKIAIKGHEKDSLTAGDLKGKQEGEFGLQVREKDLNEDGSVTVTAEISDNRGNKKTSEQTYYVSLNKPKVTVSTDSEALTVGNTLILQGDLDFSVNRVIDKVGEKELKIVDESGKPLTLTESNGKYRYNGTRPFVISVDNTGRESDRVDVIGELFGKNVVRVVSDREKPVANVEMPEGYELSGVLTYGKLPSVTFKSSDDVGIKSFKVMLDGKVIREESFDSEIKTLHNLNDLVLSESDLGDGDEHTVSIEVVDHSGKTTKTEKRFRVDKSVYVPTKVEVDKEYKVTRKGLVFRDNPKIKVIPKDDWIGDLSVLWNGVKKGIGESYEITGNGDVKVALESYRGVSDEVDLGKLITGKQDYPIVIDNVDPVTEFTLGEPALTIDGQDWYGNLKTVPVKLTDNFAIHKYEYEVNGVGFEAEFDVDTTDFNLEIDLNKFEQPEDGRYEIQVRTYDLSSRANVKTKVIYVDNVSELEVTSLKSATEYNKTSEGIFAKEPLTLQFESTPVKIGYKQINFYDKDGNLVKSEPFTNEFVWEDPNIVEIELENLLNIKGKRQNIFDLLVGNGKDLRYVIDNKAPEVNLQLSEGSVELDGAVWYNKPVELGLTAKDNEGVSKLNVFVNGELVEFNDISVGDFSINLANYKRNEDGSYIIKAVASDGAGNETVLDRSIYVDDVKPEVKNFNFYQEGYKEGKTLVVDSDDYGFFFKDGTDVEVSFGDNVGTSGIKSVEIDLTSHDGSTQKVDAEIKNNVALFHIPEGFKGWVSAKVTDNVGNESEVMKADGVITEGANWFASTSKVNLSLPANSVTDLAGLPLYANDVTVSADLSAPVAGIRSVAWSHGGNVVSDNFEVTAKDKNLNVYATSSLAISSNQNANNVSLLVTDGAGHESTKGIDFSIDKDAPILSLAWDNNNATNGKYYNAPRTATITIQERNFRASDVQISGSNVGVSWSSNGDTHTGVVTFSEDGTYNLSVSYTDMVGNVGNTVTSEEFIIDRSTPTLSLAFDNNDVKNSLYYNKPRIATLTVQDTNFDPASAKVEGAGVVPGWVSAGGTHTATISFDKDGEYEFSVQVNDLAGNQSNSVSSEKFIVDLEKPSMTISGVTDGASYNKDILPVIEFSDKYLENGSFKATLEGKRNKTIEVEGELKDGKFYVANLPKDPFYDDIYTLTAEVSDLAGNIEKQSVTYVVNRFGSTFKWEPASFEGKFLKDIREDIVLVETSATEVDTDKNIYTVQLNNSDYKLSEKPKIDHEVNGQGYNVYKYSFGKEQFDKEGLWSISVATQDKHGTQQDTSELVYQFVLDKTKPSAKIQGVSTGEFIQSDSKDVVLVIGDNVAVDYAEYTLNGETRKFTEEELVNRTKTVKISGSDKVKELKLKVVDKAGWVSEEVVSNYSLSSSVIEAIQHNKTISNAVPFIGTGVVVGLLGLFAFLFKKKREEEEKEHSELHKELDKQIDSTDIL